ncbi:MAG: electron transfer flavoprotein subunit alpha/FixB family protein, partial [Escherichia coli]|nr:electron transfer flavoprotein subunit alpha/FixB family protein [Escherichia coli]
QVTSLDIPTVSVRKSHWGNALTATLQTEKRPLCLSLARQAGAAKNATLPSGMQQLNIVPGALPDWLVSTEDLKNVTRDPLAEARRVLVVGQGGEADNQEIAMLAEKLGAEVGYSRARVMNGGVDAEKVIGISGHLLAPEVCIVVGASGAAALMAGVRNSKFVVAINHDASAAVFSQADVGVVDDWKVVLEALVTNIHADCQ